MSATYYPIAIGLLNQVKGWRDSEGNESFPLELRMNIDALLMAHEARMIEHWKPHGATPETTLRGAIGGMLSAMVRMIPEACHEHGLQQTMDREHDQAMVDAATALYGVDRSTWPPVLRQIAEGKYK